MSTFVLCLFAGVFGLPRVVIFIAQAGNNAITPDSFISLGMVAAVIGGTAFIVRKLSKIEHSIAIAQHAASAANKRTIGMLRVLRGLINGLGLDKSERDNLHSQIDGLLVPMKMGNDDNEDGE